MYGHGASTPGLLAATAAYDEGEEWLDDVLRYLDGNRRLLAELLADATAAGAATAARGHLPGLAGLPGSSGIEGSGRRVLPRAGRRRARRRAGVRRARAPATCG